MPRRRNMGCTRQAAASPRPGSAASRLAAVTAGRLEVRPHLRQPDVGPDRARGGRVVTASERKGRTCSGESGWRWQLRHRHRVRNNCSARSSRARRAGALADRARRRGHARVARPCQRAPDEFSTACVIVTAPPEDFVPDSLRATPSSASWGCTSAIRPGGAGHGADQGARSRSRPDPADALTVFQSMIDPTAPKGMRNYWRGDTSAPPRRRH